MPTIDALDPVVAAADDDALPVSQGGAVRRVTRGQLLAGMQPELSVMSGGLLGRTSAGFGEPERIGVGANLRMVGGVLSGAAPFVVGELPAGVGPDPNDLVALSQAGSDQAVTVASLLGGLSHVPGIDLSAQVLRVGTGFARTLADWASDAVPVEAFGAVGDGVTDDQAAFDRAVTSGHPVRLRDRTYVVNGQWTVTRRAMLIGIPGLSVMRRASQAGGAWISAGGPSFAATGITFDAGSLGGDSWGVLVTPGCRETLFDQCVFENATGEALGSGLTIQARDGLHDSPSQHVVRGCTARGNSVHGIWVQAAAGAVVQGCLASGNGGYGICLDYNDPAFQTVVRQSQVLGCRAWGNQRGISVGNFNETNAEPPRWGVANPDAVGVLVAGNSCHDNSAYGIAIAGDSLQLMGNRVETGQQLGASGILMNCSASVADGNTVSGPGQYGIDAGGCVDCDVVRNLVQGFAVGINPGGSRGVRVAENRLLRNVWGITAYQVETDGSGRNFGIACDGLQLVGNAVQLKDGSGGGIFLIDGPQNVQIARNDFQGGMGSVAAQALWAHTDSVVIQGNTWNNLARIICNPVNAGGLGQVQVPDALDAAMLTSVSRPIGSIVGQHQAAMAGQVSFVRVTSGGSGYSAATVTISGGGTGASATCYVRDGTVIGIALLSGGAGFGAAGAVASIAGDGQGATAVAYVGLPVPEGRSLRLACNCSVRFTRTGSAPFQDNWTGADIDVPAASAIEWTGTWGGWQATAFTLGDYLTPNGDGSVVLRSNSGDVALRPAGAGQVRIGSDGEPSGFVSALGRGSPEGLVVAPAGSDYRNLDGGAGTTLWLKRRGSGASGWAAIG